MSISNYFETELLKALKNESPAVANVYVKLHKGDPGEDGTAEAAGETTRKKVTTWKAPASGVIKNETELLWSAVSTSETYTHVSLWDAEAAGNCLWTGALESSKAVSSGDNFALKAEQLSVSLD